MKLFNMMRNRKSQLYIFIMLLFVCLFAIGNISVHAKQYSNSSSKNTTKASERVVKSEEMQVHFIDVGQGSATLITCEGHSMLVDAGGMSKGTTVQLYLKKHNVTELEYLVLTHPDEDHIGGADVIVTKYDIGKIYMSSFENDTKAYDELINALKYRNYDYSIPEVGQQVKLGSAVITFIAPAKTFEDANNSSISFILDYGSTSFLFTGDSEEEAEEEILNTVNNLDVDVYLAGHHGSRHSSSEELLDAATPDYVVISCGKDNDYGHPTSETLNRLKKRNIKVFRTDEQGSIVAISDGKNITWDKEPSTTWKAGTLLEDSKNVESKTDKIINANPELEKYRIKNQNSNKDSLIDEKDSTADISGNQNSTIEYVLNTNSLKIHYSSCRHAKRIAAHNYATSNLSVTELKSQGYTTCGFCFK